MCLPRVEEGGWEVTKGCPRTVREVEIIDMLKSFFLMIIVFTSLTERRQPSPRFHIEAWLPFRSSEMDYLSWRSRKCL